MPNAVLSKQRSFPPLLVREQAQQRSQHLSNSNQSAEQEAANVETMSSHLMITRRRQWADGIDQNMRPPALGAEFVLSCRIAMGLLCHVVKTQLQRQLRS